MVLLTCNQYKSTTINGFLNIVPLYQGYGITGVTGTNGYTGATGASIYPVGNIIAQPDVNIAGSLNVVGNITCLNGVGYTGATGAAGYTGTMGNTGASGNTGATGRTGATGFTGPMGATGAAGAAGTLGQAGYTGPTGTIGASPFVISGSNIYYSVGNVSIGKSGNTSTLDIAGSLSVSGTITTPNMITNSSSVNIPEPTLPVGTIINTNVNTAINTLVSNVNVFQVQTSPYTNASINFTSPLGFYTGAFDTNNQIVIQSITMTANVYKNGSLWASNGSIAYSGSASQNSYYYYSNYSFSFTPDYDGNTDTYVIYLNLNNTVKFSTSGAFFLLNTTITGTNYTAASINTTITTSPSTISSGTLQTNNLLSKSLWTNSVSISGGLCASSIGATTGNFTKKLIAPTQLAGESSTNVATTAFVGSSVSTAVNNSVGNSYLSLYSFTQSSVRFICGVPLGISVAAYGNQYNVTVGLPRRIQALFPISNIQSIQNTQANVLTGVNSTNGSFYFWFTDSNGNDIGPNNSYYTTALIICS